MATQGMPHDDGADRNHRGSGDSSEGGSEGSLSLSDEGCSCSEESLSSLSDGGGRSEVIVLAVSSDAADDDESWHSSFDSAAGGSSHDEHYLSCVSDAEIHEDVSDQVDKVDLEAGGKDCWICRKSWNSVNHENGIPIHLGCLCKGDLAVVHKQCATTWYQIKGNKNCEICGATARNVFCKEKEKEKKRSNCTECCCCTHVQFSCDFWRDDHPFPMIYLFFFLFFVIYPTFLVITDGFSNWPP